jgi:hypothetical protein
MPHERDRSGRRGVSEAPLEERPEFARACGEHGLPAYYQPSVRPLFAMPATQWPRCCGSSCEPCAETLIAVATRVCELLEVDVASLPR